MVEERIFVGVARVQLGIPGARSLKDRRQNIRSVADRMRHKFSVTVNEVGGSDYPGRQVLALTTAGNDSRLIRSILDRCVALASGSGRVLVESVDVDVFRWQADLRRWADDSMDEYGSATEDGDE